MAKHWELKSKAPQEYMREHGNRHQLLAQLLFNRGLAEEGSIEAFLHPQYEAMHSPFLFRDMQKTVERIWRAVEQNEKIVVYGDYDADGVTATAILVQAFRYIGVEARWYMPDRFSEGYGLNLEAFQKLKQEGAEVVISVDCGTNAVDVADWCKANDIDLIITDHHEITGANPDAYSLVNPKNPGDAYPDSQITGAGVAYKVAVALLSDIEKVKRRLESIHAKYVEHWDKWLLDLASIGTVADCHSLFGENRTIVAFGLKVLQKTKWTGLRALLGLVSKNQSYDTYTIGFLLAPRINAAGRLEHASVALDLLLSGNPEEADALVHSLDQINARRQELTQRLVSEAKEQALLQPDRKILVLSSPDWHKGVVGLVAGKLASELHKPVIVLEKGEEESTGSARSVGGFDIVECLKSAKEHLMKFGGHKQAAGLTLRTENIDSFYKAVLEYAETNVRDEDSRALLELEAELQPHDLTLDVYDIISELEPFGFGNERPKFLLRNATVQTQRVVGNGEKHLQMTLDLNGHVAQCIAFNMAYVCDTIKPGDRIDVACEIMADSWNGYRKLKLRIIDCVLHNETTTY